MAPLEAEDKRPKDTDLQSANVRGETMARGQLAKLPLPMSYLTTSPRPGLFEKLRAQQQKKAADGFIPVPSLLPQPSKVAWLQQLGQTVVFPTFDGARLVVVSHKPHAVVGIDPASGKVNWSSPIFLQRSPKLTHPCLPELTQASGRI
jgi:hypothetical protein